LQIPSTSDSFHFSLYATRTIPNASSILAETAIVSEQQQPSQQASGYHKAEYQTQAERHRKLKSGSEYSGFSKGRLLWLSTMLWVLSLLWHTWAWNELIF
jgi:hypothetical protein